VFVVVKSAMDYRRSRSQSRFPPIDEHPGGYPTGQPLDNSHRSKSLDNRRDFVPDDEYDPYRSIERNSTFHASLGGNRQPRREQHEGQQRGGGDFFNETITIPSAHTKSNHKFDSRHEGADDDWTSYDRQVRYHTERTAYPSRGPPPPLYYDNYGYRNQIQGPPPQELSPRSAISRYPESDLYDRRYDRNYQLQQQHDYRNENDGRLRTHGHYAAEGYGEEDEYLTKERQSNIGGINRINESAGAAAVAGGRSGGGGGGHYRHHHESYSHGGGGAAGGATGKAHYGQTNGYSQNAFAQQREKRSGGGFFGSGQRKGAGSTGVEPRERVYHRIHCCCFTFKWPPFAYEECEPPRPMYVKPPKDSPMPSRHTLPPPPPQY
jgi:hypothetical protein